MVENQLKDIFTRDTGVKSQHIFEYIVDAYNACVGDSCSLFNLPLIEDFEYFIDRLLHDKNTRRFIDNIKINEDKFFFGQTVADYIKCMRKNSNDTSLLLIELNKIEICEE